MKKELLLFAEDVYIEKNQNKIQSAQSQVFEGFSLIENVDCVVK